MTRVLSELLGAHEPHFQQGLIQLERLAGHPSADIRLTTELQQLARTKAGQLGLDCHDTTGPEWYAALGARLRADEARFRAAVGAHAGTDIPAHVIRSLQSQISPKRTYALKSTVARRLLRAAPPRRVMKSLGYRSADSMLKHESVACLLAAAWLVEPETWAKRWFAGYKKLAANDFESRDIVIEHPSSKRWQELADQTVPTRMQTVLSFKELGSVVVLPLPVDRPPLAALTLAVLTVHATNEIRAAGTYLKLHQLQSGFGLTLQSVVASEQLFAAEAIERSVSWQTLHRFFDRLQDVIQADIFEPLVAAEDLVWQSAEKLLTKIEPSLEFWLPTSHLGVLEAGQAVSCNLTDSLLSHGNALPFEQRVVDYFRQSLHAELLLRYVSADHLQQALLGNLHMKLAPEMASL